MQNCPYLLCYLGVSCCRKEGVKFGSVAHLDLDDPGAVGILVDKFGLVFEFFVDGDHFAAYGSIQLAGSLDALQCAEILALGDAVTFGGGIDIGNVTHFFLCEIADTDDGDVAVDFDPFVGLTVKEFF